MHYESLTEGIRVQVQPRFSLARSEPGRQLEPRLLGLRRRVRRAECVPRMFPPGGP